jgi:hypothetical protein
VADVSDRDDRFALDDMARQLVGNDDFEELEAELRLNATPLTRVYVDGEATLVSAPHMSTESESKLEVLARGVYREMGPPPAA